MGLWKTRHKSMEGLARELKPQAVAIERVFDVIDQCTGLFDSESEASEYHRVCGITLAKARNYALGAYSLMLDGLGQEAGALIRPFIEYYELLVYFRVDPARVKEAIDDKLPSAGKRAKIIEGGMQGFRDYLNNNASHSSYSSYSLDHLIDKSDMTIRKEQSFVIHVLNRNMGDLFVQLILLAIEAVKCIEINKREIADDQIKELEALREYGTQVFRFEK